MEDILSTSRPPLFKDPDYQIALLLVLLDFGAGACLIALTADLSSRMKLGCAVLGSLFVAISLLPLVLSLLRWPRKPESRIVLLTPISLHRPPPRPSINFGVPFAIGVILTSAILLVLPRVVGSDEPNCGSTQNTTAQSVTIATPVVQQRNVAASDLAEEGIVETGDDDRRLFHLLTAETHVQGFRGRCIVFTSTVLDAETQHVLENETDRATLLVQTDSEQLSVKIALQVPDQRRCVVVRVAAYETTSLKTRPASNNATDSRTERTLITSADSDRFDTHASTGDACHGR